MQFYKGQTAEKLQLHRNSAYFHAPYPVEQLLQDLRAASDRGEGGEARREGQKEGRKK